MEWIGPLLISILVLAGLLELFWAYSLSAIAQKTDQGSAMEILAWIPLLQIGPMLVAGGASIGLFVLGGIGLIAATASLLGVSAFLGNGLGSLVATLGVGLTCLVCVVYTARILWETAIARGVSGWVGLLVFVPVVNFFVYPYLAFHDGWVRPNRIGLVLGSGLVLISSAPSVSAIHTAMEAMQADEFSADRLIADLTWASKHEEGDAAASLSNEADSTAARTELGEPEIQSIHALYALKSRFDSLEVLSRSGQDREAALDLIASIRNDLDSSRETLDAAAFGDLAAHLIEIESLLVTPTERDSAPPRSRRRIRGEPNPGFGPAAPRMRHASETPSFNDSNLVPTYPFPIRANEECPRDTRLRTARDANAEEEWCQQEAVAGGLKHGFYTRYRADGRPESTGQYREGLRVGVWTRFHPNGRVRAQAEFRDGMQHGWVLTFDPSGKRTKSARFEQGAPVGPD